MNEFDQAWLLNNRLESGDVTLETITNLAKTIATYHKGCDRDARIADWGRAEIVKRAFDQNYFQTARFIGSLLSQQQFDECKRFSDGFFSQPDSQKWLEERRATGFIRRCHGDLHPRNVVIEPNGKIVLFDCIEFSEEFSCVDTMYDIAFLLVGLLAKVCATR
jgi:aminoglycoside phosphotransferase family enzyme